jgi:rod shape-determining protein MreD
MRNAGFLGLGVLLILVQGNLYRLIAPLARFMGWLWSTGDVAGLTPSLLLPLIIFLGVHEHSMPRGALLAFVFGYLTDLLSGAPIMLFTFISVVIWWLSRVLGVRLTAQTFLTRMSLAFLFALVEGGMVLMLLAIFGADNRRPLEILVTVVPHAVTTALCSPIVFRLARRLHQGTLSVQAAGEGSP